MRISDWSSDVCSSDLGQSGELRARGNPFGTVRVIGSTAERLEGRAMNADDMKVETFACVFDAIADTPEEATELRTRADLMRGITARVKSWDVPLGEAAKRLGLTPRSEEHTSELQSLMRISYAVFCLKKKKR